MPPRSLALWPPAALTEDRLFDLASLAIGDDLLLGFRELQVRITELGGACHTHDVFSRHGTTPDVVLFLDIPSEPVAELVERWPQSTRWVYLQENEVILPRNWDRRLHLQFERVFTWHDELVDGDRYVKLNYANGLMPNVQRSIPFEQRGLCTMIAGNKGASHHLSLYDERVKAIRWFERHQPDEFDLYGVGWDERRISRPRPLRALNRVRAARRALAFGRRFPSYRGRVASKRATYEKYRFALCFENARDIPGYVSEKIFDCFRAGIIPIYRGAENIADHVPADCFIDLREFSDYAELRAFLTSMSEEEHRDRVARIGQFLSGPRASPFSVEAFVNTIVHELLEERQ